jgi:hypothetical protein
MLSLEGRDQAQALDGVGHEIGDMAQHVQAVKHRRVRALRRVGQHEIDQAACETEIVMERMPDHRHRLRPHDGQIIQLVHGTVQALLGFP